MQKTTIDEKVYRVRRKPSEDNPQMECACGCGVAFLKYHAEGWSRRFLPSHNLRLNPRWCAHAKK